MYINISFNDVCRIFSLTDRPYRSSLQVVLQVSLAGRPYRSALQVGLQVGLPGLPYSVL